MERDKEDSSRADSADELKLDFSRITSFFKDKKKIAVLLTALFILVPVMLTFYIRLAPEQLPQTDAWAANAVNNYFRNQIAQGVNTQYPNLPTANKNQLIDQQFAQFQESNKAMLDEQIKGTSDFFKTGFRYEENNHTYTFLGDLDSYFYLRQARNLEAKGTVCDEIKADGTCWDTYLLAPIGSYATPTLHPYGIVLVHKVLGFFNPSINLMRASFLLPTILAAIAAVVAFFLGRRLMNSVAGFFAAMFVALNPMLITRTLGSDTDIWNVVLPLVIIWVFVEAFESEKLGWKIALASLAGLFSGIFAFAWGGWWYIFDFIIMASLGYAYIAVAKSFIMHKYHSGTRRAMHAVMAVILAPAYILFILGTYAHSMTRTKDKRFTLFTDDTRTALMLIGIFIVSTAIFVTLFVSFQTMVSVLVAPFSTFTTLKAAVHATLWPNVFTTVAELNEANLSTIVAQTAFGVKWLFAVALLGIVFIMIKRKPETKEYVLITAAVLVFAYLISDSAFALHPYTYVFVLMLPVIAALVLFLTEAHTRLDIKPALIFTLWFMGMIVASIKGVRFILLLTPIFSIAVGVAIGYLFQYLSAVLRKELNLSSAISKLIIFAALAMILLVPVRSGIASGESFTPSMTKGWWDSLTKIKEESAPDAIINSWWDFGHWFKYVADRRVTLDGVTQNSPRAHWLGKVLQTSDEKEAVAILKMLDCGGETAFEEVDSVFNDTERSHNVISRLLLMEDGAAKTYLRSLGFKEDQSGRITDAMYCQPPEDYFITSEDMVGKAGVWAHFGLWDFDRSFMIVNVKPKSLDEGTRVLQNRFNYSNQEATSIYYDLQSLQTDREMNDWISPWPNYFTQGWVGCIEKNNTQDFTDPETNVTESVVTGKSILCTINRVVSQSSQGQTLLEGAIFDYNNPQNSTLVISSIDSTGARRGSGLARPSSFLLMDEESIERVVMDNVTFPFDVLIDTVGKRLLITDPQLSESLFTKLFYLDGRYTEHFEKFSDLTDVAGTRIIVWKVKWS